MWDPRRYVDTDFGLEGDEQFEPGEDRQFEGPDLASAHVMTVLGPISPDDLGPCMASETILPPGSAVPVRMRHAADELEAYFTVGGRAMADLATADSGRDAESLRTLAQIVPVHIIASTGAASPDAAGAYGLISRTVEECRTGIGDTGIRPGVIRASIDTFELAHGAAAETGLPVSLQVPEPGRALVLPAHASRTIVGGFNRDPTIDESLAILETGSWLSIDRVGHDDGGDPGRARLVVELSERGFGDRILLGQRLEPSHFVTHGSGPGWIHLLERFAISLLEAGGTGALVRSLLVDNQAAALTILPPGTSM